MTNEARSVVNKPVSRRSFVAASAASVLSASSKTWANLHSAPDDLCYCSVMTISKAIRSKKMSSEEVVRALLRRIDVVNPKINAVVTSAANRALDEAKRADAELARGHCRGPLHGVPMTIKDSFDTEGVVSTAGTKGRRHFIPKRDATAVARLRNAGAILLGKTNTPEFTMNYDTRNLLFGSTKNPYKVRMSPGGSSGGAASNPVRDGIAVGRAHRQLPLPGVGRRRRHEGTNQIKPGTVPFAVAK